MSPVTSTSFIPIKLHIHCYFMLVVIFILDIKQWQLWRRNMRSLTDFATWRWNVVETFFNLLSLVINIPAIMCYLGERFDNWWLRCTICTSYESTENMQHKYNEAVKSPACFFFLCLFLLPLPFSWILHCDVDLYVELCVDVVLRCSPVDKTYYKWKYCTRRRGRQPLE